MFTIEMQYLLHRYDINVHFSFHFAFLFCSMKEHHRDMDYSMFCHLWKAKQSEFIFRWRWFFFGIEQDV